MQINSSPELFAHMESPIGTLWTPISLRHNARQCRRPWKNSVEPSFEICDWIQEEEMRFVQQVDALGPGWELIAEFFQD
jgi:hypothetical protein